MPTSLSASHNTSLKSFRLTALLLLSPLTFFAQQLTGLWVGTLSNDSSTIRKDQSFEIALTEYRGKVYGYSRSEFIVNDTLYYVVKRVKGTINGDVCEVKDDEIISYNFPTRLDKGVKVVSTFLRDKKDSTWYLAGTWKTNRTKNFYSVSGKVDLEEEKDFSKSKLFPHLEELNLANDVAFYKESKKPPEPIAKTEPVVPDKKLKTSIKTEEQTTINNTASVTPATQQVSVNTVPVSSTQVIRTTATPGKAEPLAIPTTTSASVITPELKEDPKRKISSIKTEPQETITNSAVVSTKPDTKKVEITTVPVTSKPVNVIATTTKVKKPAIITMPVKTNTDIVAITPMPEKKEVMTPPVTTTVIKKRAVDLNAPAALVDERAFVFSQPVNFKSDSLELSLYDNGEIDGDTVSVLLNGEVILAKQGLKASAIKKTIYITPGSSDSLVLVLYAENLGKYPPNTGLLVVHDGDDVYQVRFSADLEKNAAVILRRKKK
jgi:hypothetical protein